MAQETEEDKGFLQSTADFFKNLDYGELAESSIPLVGENLIIGDIKENLASNSYGSAAINAAALALGTVPIVGDLAAKPFKELAKKYSKAKDALKEGIKKNPTNLLLKEPATHFFKTAKGSEYVRVQGGTTVRHKEPRKDPGHEGAKGFQVPSSTTIFVDEKGAKIASQFYRASETPDLLGKRQLIPTEKNKAHIVFSESFSPPTKTSNAILKRMGYKTKIESGDVVKNSEFLFSTTPKTGTYPLEIYNSGTGIHIGNKITEVAPVSAADILKYTKTELKMAKGGPVMALEEQTEMAFGDQPPRVDPVSGNEVPPGALPSEVRDDIPARLSEGEYVVPADVLQFFGIKFFEDLRTKAKTELAGLEEGGRMGGEPMPMEGQEELPFSLDELQKYSDEDDGMAANKGGMVSGFNEGGSTDSDTPNYPSGATSVFNMPSTIFKTFINEAGLKMYIRFVNGVPMSPIPTGYTEEGVSVEVAAPIQTPREPEDNRSQEAIDLENSPFVKPFEIMTRAELARFAAEISKTKVYKAITSYGLISLGAKGQEKRWADYVTKVSENGTQGQIDFVNGLQTNIDAGDRDANIAIAKVNNGGKDVTHLDIMTGDPRYLSRTLTSNIGISDGDSISGLDGGSSTSVDGTPPYIPIDYSDDVLSADFVGDDDTTDPAITESRYDDADDFEGGGEGGESKVEEPTYTETVRNRIERERAEKMAAIEEQLQEDRDGDRDAENRQDQKKAEEKEKSSKGIAERVERARSGVGGFNKGGLASRKSKKKKK